MLKLLVVTSLLLRVQHWLENAKVLERCLLQNFQSLKTRWGQDNPGELFLQLSSQYFTLLSVRYKSHLNTFWLHLNVGSLTLVSDEQGLTSLDHVELNLLALNIMNANAGAGCITLQLQPDQSFALMYTAPLPWSALLQQKTFVAFVENLKQEVILRLNPQLEQFRQELAQQDAIASEFDLDLLAEDGEPTS